MFALTTTTIMTKLVTPIAIIERVGAILIAK